MVLAPVFELSGIARDYAWGSTSAIQDILGQERDGRPLAELWFGAHPDGPAAALRLGRHMDELIESDPSGLLGQDVAARFDGGLPFLIKILAADAALSIQVHPTIEQARAGFAAEEAAGVPRDASNRNYRDPNHKPELLCALTPFEALCGFRPIVQTLTVLRRFGLPELETVAGMLTVGGGDAGAPDGAEPLRAAFTYLLTLPSPEALVARVAARAWELLAEDPSDGAARAVRLAAGDFPGDIGAVLSLLLNYVTLEPGDAIFLEAGNVHAYLRGVGVEIMANSDNVLRCGLTHKHVDVPELMRITDFSELAEPRFPSDGVTYEPPVPDFAMTRTRVDGCAAVTAASGPQIVVAAEGAFDVGFTDGAVPLHAGAAAFVRPGTPVTLAGSGLAFLATDGLSRRDGGHAAGQ